MEKKDTKISFLFIYMDGVMWHRHLEQDMYRIDLQIMPNARADRVRCYVVGASYSFYLTLALALSQQQCLRKIQKKKCIS